MSEPQPSWLYRLFAALPPLPDWYLPVCILAAVGMLGFALAMVVCAIRHTPDSTAATTRLLTLAQEPGLTTRVQTLEERLRAVEQQGLALKLLESRLGLLEHQLKQQGLVP